MQGDPSGPNLGQFREALTSYGKALSLVRPLAEKRRDYESMSCAAWLYYKCGDLELRTKGVEQAITSYLSGLKVANDIKSQDPKADELLMNGYMRLASAKARVGSPKDALIDAQMAADAADRSAKLRKSGAENVAKTRLLVGNLLWLHGDLKGAWNRYQEAVTLLERMTESDPDHPAILEDLGEAYRRCGDLQGNPAYFHFGDLEKAKFYQRKALKIAEQLAARDPKDAMARSHLSVALRRMGAIQRSTEPAQAIELYRESLEVLQTLVTGTPGDLNYSRDLANTHLGLSAALRNSRQYRQALDEVNIALTLQREMLKRTPQRIAVREDMFDALLAVAELRLDTRELDAALEGFNEALRSAQFLYDRNKDSLYSERCLASVYQGLAEYHTYLGKRGPAAGRKRHTIEAVGWYDRAAAIWTRWRTQNLAVPFSTNREREIFRARAALQPFYHRSCDRAGTLFDRSSVENPRAALGIPELSAAAGSDCSRDSRG